MQDDPGPKILTAAAPAAITEEAVSSVHQVIPAVRTDHFPLYLRNTSWFFLQYLKFL
jgi:hypothetical protein